MTDLTPAEELCTVWIPTRQQYVILANAIEARDFAEKFGGIVEHIVEKKP